MIQYSDYNASKAIAYPDHSDVLQLAAGEMTGVRKYTLKLCVHVYVYLKCQHLLTRGQDDCDLCAILHDRSVQLILFPLRAYFVLALFFRSTNASILRLTVNRA